MKSLYNAVSPAEAYTIRGIVVTEERFKENSAGIPNIGKHFSVKFTNLRKLLIELRWRFQT
ncbi:MAG: DUF4411 family protein [Candidatus Cloacimonetes bacterium]|nr:DUF4411 family protein [Candidatus Cloacimonadota bacterium]